MAKKDKLLGANRFNYIVDHYTKLHEKQMNEKSINNICDPVLNELHVEPSLLPSTGRVKRNNKDEMCYNIRIHTQKHMQALTKETVIKT